MGPVENQVRSPEVFEYLSPQVPESPKSSGRSPGSPIFDLPEFPNNSLSDLFTIAQEIRNMIFARLSLLELSFMTRITKQAVSLRQVTFQEYVRDNPHAMSNILCRVLRLEVRYPHESRLSKWSRSFLTHPYCKNTKHLDLSGLDTEDFHNNRALRLKIIARTRELVPTIESLDTGTQTFATIDGERGLEEIAKFENLTRLALRNFHVTPQVVKTLATWDLNWLIIDSPASRVLGLQSIQQMTNLRGLILKGQGIGFPDAQMQLLAPLNNLRFLGLCGRSIGPVALKQIQHLTNLEGLDFTDCQFITDQSVLLAAAFPKLTHLGLGGKTKITDKALTYIAAQFLFLRELSLCSLKKITDNGLKALENHPALQRLNVANCEKLTARTLATLRTLPQLGWVDLTNCSGIQAFAAIQFAKERNVTVLVGHTQGPLPNTTINPSSFVRFQHLQSVQDREEPRVFHHALEAKRIDFGCD